MDALIGRSFGNYRVLSLLGEGGMGAVYLAEHPGIGRKAAVKVLHPQVAHDAGLVVRFMNEARAATAIRHPNIIEILDAGTLEDGTAYIMMEFLEGQSLAGRLRDRGRLEIPETLDITAQTAAALAAAHAKGIVHRDLKPDNLYVVPDEIEQRERVKVLDFGIAKLKGPLGGGSSSGSVRTQTGALMGTPVYMSPEQCRGTKEIDHRSDIYSLGIIVYEMLCGAPPFVSDGFGELIHLHMNVAPESPRARRPELPEAIEAAVMRCLAKRPEDRFQSMNELRAGLGVRSGVTVQPGTASVASSGTVAFNPAPAPTPVPANVTTFSHGAGQVGDDFEDELPPRRRTPLYAAVAAVAVLGVGGAVFALRGKPAVDAPRPPAAATPAPAPAVVPPPAPAPVAVPAPPPAPARIKLHIDSRPTGAVVRSASDRTVLGNTPLELTLPKADVPLQIVVEKEGYKPREESISQAGDSSLTVPLARHRSSSSPRPAAAPDSDELRKL